MKRLGRVMGNLFAMALAVVTLQAAAAELGGRDFNHMTTGFPLSGGHATAACETCHVGGVFKGTPRNCDGCHALGKRVVATPKSTSHIVTDAQCDTCHFNTSTFLGARFNHGTATPGQCTTCHNGRIAQGKGTNALHFGVFANNSCDSCHRTSSWIPASWNHTGASYGQDCSACHGGAGPGRSKPAASHALFTSMGIAGCRTCHKSYTNFFSVFYDHAGASPLCGTCHNNGAYAAGVKQIVTTAKHNVFTVNAGISNCQSCHKSYAAGSFPSGRYDHAGAGACQTCHTAANSPYIRAMSANHIPIPVSSTCTTCHVSAAAWSAVARGAALHAVVAATPCYTCHGSNTAYPNNGQRLASWPNFHKSSKNPAATDCSAGGCHAPAGSRGVAYINWD